MNTENTIKIDAAGKSLGRTASSIASLLMGKTTPAFRKNKAGAEKVLVENASKMKIPLAKKTTKEYEFYSGYPGGFRREKLELLLAKKGYAEILRWAVAGMMPKNKLTKHRMKKLTVKE